MILYKLTDADDSTGPERDCQWGEGITHTADGNGELCTKHWIHAYTHPLIAVFMNPVHGMYDLETAHLWECKGEIGIDDNDLKCGTKKLTAIKQVSLPKLSAEQRVEIAIRVSLLVYKERKYQRWAENWLNGKDRSGAAADESADESAARPAKNSVWAAHSASRSAVEYIRYVAEPAGVAKPAWYAAWSVVWSNAETVWSAIPKINILEVIQSVVNAYKD